MWFETFLFDVSLVGATMDNLLFDNFNGLRVCFEFSDGYFLFIQTVLQLLLSLFKLLDCQVTLLVFFFERLQFFLEILRLIFFIITWAGRRIWLFGSLKLILQLLNFLQELSSLLSALQLKLFDLLICSLQLLLKLRNLAIGSILQRFKLSLQRLIFQFFVSQFTFQHLHLLLKVLVFFLTVTQLSLRGLQVSLGVLELQF